MTATRLVKKSSKKNLLQSIFFVFIFLMAAYVMTRSSLFEVKEIRVSGNNLLNTETIISVSGLNLGVNIFKLDLKAATENLKIISLVKNVAMSRRLPSVVEITVEERKPSALLSVDSGGFVQVDDGGFYLQKGDIGKDQLPVLTGFTVDLPAPGEPLKSEALITGLTVINGLPPELVLQLSEVNINVDRIGVYTLDGIRCHLGSTVDLEQKGRVLINVLDDLKLKGKRIEYIDLSHAGSPVVKYSK